VSAPGRGLAALVEVLGAMGRPLSSLRPEALLEEDLGLRPDRCEEALRLAAATLGLEPPRSGGERTLAELARALEGDPRVAPRLPLTGQVAFVTGSGHGLGKCLAAELAARGATVVVNSFHSRDRGESTAAELCAAGHQAVHIWGSVANPRQLDAIFDEIEQRFGRLDVFIQNASNGYLGPLEYATPEHWEKSYRTNVVSLHQGALRAAALMKDGGSIAGLSTPAAQHCTPLFGLQGPVKAAIEALVRYLALELAPRGIRVNAFAPGAIYGELLNRYPDAARLIPAWEALTAGNRLCTEEEVAHSIVQFMTDPGQEAWGSLVLSDAGVSKVMQRQH
jgi:NAD(P)-dependent dehydrogenase (short-subunit alcohol dehydrogenase family)